MALYQRYVSTVSEAVATIADFLSEFKDDLRGLHSAKRSNLLKDACKRTKAVSQMLRTRLYTAGFPCQNFSSSGNNEGEFGVHFKVLRAVLRHIVSSLPSMTVLENVKGIWVRHRKVVLVIIRTLQRAGYNIWCGFLDATRVVPQCRVICF